MLEIFFFALINVSYLTEKGDRGSHIFFTTIKAVCVAQIYFFLRSLKGQILRQTHGCLVCPGNFFPIFLLAGFSGVLDVQRVQILGI